VTRHRLPRRCVALVAVATLTVASGIGCYAVARRSGGVHRSAHGSVWTRTAGGGTSAAPPVVPSATPSAPAAPSVPAAPSAAAAPNISGTWTAWALLDRRTGTIHGSANLAETNNTESMIKIWIASDDLRRLDVSGTEPTATELATLSRMIRDSDDGAAQSVYQRNGADAVISRLIATCGLTDTSLHHQWWSYTQMSPRDAVRMGACVADGQAAGARWTPWVLNEMRHVRGEGRFGIVDALSPGEAQSVAIKNGWTLHYAEHEWNINCLAVETRFPAATGGLTHGAGICADTTRTVAGAHPLGG